MFVWTWVVAASVHAATVWTGPLITYSQPSPDPTQATNQDRITPNVWLTRAASGGLFNAVTETSFTNTSPADTLWAFGTLDAYASLPYTNWLVWLNGKSPTTMVGSNIVVHLLSDDIYLSFKFSFWGSKGSGGFTYQRSTPSVPASAVVLSGGKVENGQFCFNYTADQDHSYVIQSSPNLLNWSSLQTNVATTSLVLFCDPLAATGTKFYRIAIGAKP